MLNTYRRAASAAVALGLALGATALTPSLAGAAAQPKCLFVSSYHKGYAWSDGVERGLRSVLKGQCEIRQFDMDTKRKKTEADKQAAALAAKTMVDEWKPDVVITADDNAAKYLIKPFYKDHDVPFVFSGVNWTAKEYGFPYTNVTGIVEVAPIKPMLERAISIAKGKTAFYLGADTLTEKKNLARFEAGAEELRVTLTHALVSTMAEWEASLAKAQEASFVIMGSNSGVKDWDEAKAKAIAAKHSKKLSVTSHGWMMPVTMFGMTKVPEEHGEWGAKSALAIISGTSPADIPIVSNSRWDYWANTDLLTSAKVKLPRSLRRKAKRAGN